MRGAGLGNIETSSKMKKFAYVPLNQWLIAMLTFPSTALMEHFPTRIHAIYVIHAGLITKIMIGFAKIVFKKKMTKRVRQIILRVLAMLTPNRRSTSCPTPSLLSSSIRNTCSKNMVVTLIGKLIRNGEYWHDNAI